MTRIYDYALYGRRVVVAYIPPLHLDLGGRNELYRL